MVHKSLNTGIRYICFMQQIGQECLGVCVGKITILDLLKNRFLFFLLCEDRDCRSTEEQSSSTN